MPPQPFVLDPDFEKHLDGDAFRAVYLRKNVSSPWIYLIYFFVPVMFLVPSLAFLLMGWMTDKRDYYENAAWGLLAPVVPLIGAVIAIVVDVRHQAYQRRFAYDSEKRIGRIVTCLRKMYGRGEDTPNEYVVEVVYVVRTRSGEEIRGVRAQQRHDLLNATLPPPGTPVVVMVLDNRVQYLL
jgi:hypothetical protein